MGDSENEDRENKLAKLEPAATIPSGKVLAGADRLFDGMTHVGVAIEVAASGQVSHLIISDATRIRQGAPIFITAPVRLKGENLKKFLDGKGVTLPTQVIGLLSNLQIGCEAFYFSTEKKTWAKKEDAISELKLSENTTPKASEVTDGYEAEVGPLLMMFEIKVEGGLIKALTEDESLGSLFDVNAMMLRVIRCPATKSDILVKYVESLPS